MKLMHIKISIQDVPVSEAGTNDLDRRHGSAALSEVTIRKELTEVSRGSRRERKCPQEPYLPVIIMIKIDQMLEARTHVAQLKHLDQLLAYTFLCVHNRLFVCCRLLKCLKVLYMACKLAIFQNMNWYKKYNNFNLWHDCVNTIKT